MLAEGAGCALAWHAIKDVKTHMDRVCSLTLATPAAMQTLVRQHDEILSAVDARDPARAEAAMRHHLTEIVRVIPELELLRPELFEPRDEPLASSDGTVVPYLSAPLLAKRICPLSRR